MTKPEYDFPAMKQAKPWIPPPLPSTGPTRGDMDRAWHRAKLEGAIQVLHALEATHAQMECAIVVAKETIYKIRRENENE